jgi:hypothetical protein
MAAMMCQLQSVRTASLALMRQFDRYVPCSAYHLGRAILVLGFISQVTNERFQNQNEFFGKHGYLSIAVAYDR